MNDTTPKGRARAGLTDEGLRVVQSVVGISATIDALEAQLKTLYRQRVDLYGFGVAAGVPKVRMAEAAGCDVTAIIHALRKREQQDAPAPAGV